jgi:cellulose synthase/poly-beta-1,6-N-acetylglucosamine synthase-like glycosyltransferase/peptidoglycan/xylan/chitin deacetylase (PgdA/CDA1 family)
VPTRRTSSRRSRAEVPAPRPQPVFVDFSGRRWRALQGAGALVLVVLTAVLSWLLWPVIVLMTGQLPGPEPETVAATLGRQPVVIGTGPMLRVVAVRPDGGLTEPFTGARLGVLAAADRAAVGTHPYVVQRYGCGGGTRRIALTFDDGPDPVWTPKVLDVLARHRVRGTFFVTGRAAATSPELLRRIVAEGHALGNHSVSHQNLSEASRWRTRFEFSGNAAVLARLSGQAVEFVRPPYDGGTGGAIGDEVTAILWAQRLGYPVASYDHDTHDWAYGGGRGDSAPIAGSLPRSIPLPSLDGRDLTVLLHDSGGDRAHTVEYLDRVLIPAARRAGYTFATMPEANPQPAPGAAAGAGVPGAVGDPRTTGAVTGLVEAWLVYPNRFSWWLFALGAFTLGATGFGYTLLALVRRWRRPPPPARGSDPARDRPPLAVTVLIAAYNEEKVIAATLRGLVASTYPVLEFLVVDDGSSDRTSQIVAELSRTLDPRIRLITQTNARKPAALNTGLARTRSEIVVTVDADTNVTPGMVADLVRHFEADPYGTLGAVAGVVRVGNRQVNVLTRWQALEYLTQIGVERAAHDHLGTIMIVPGACAAWRREAVLRAGGFSGDTLAEDCDLTLGLHRMGWRVTQDDVARADTEAPETLDALLKQRVRWTFGTIQAIFKHKNMLLRPRFGLLGTVTLPWSAVSVVLPLLTIPFVTLVTVEGFLAQGPAFLGGFYLMFSAAQGLSALVAVRLLGEPLSTLSAVPFYRAVYDPLRTYLLCKAGYLAARGLPVGWNKLTRTGTVAGTAGPEASPAEPSAAPVPGGLSQIPAQPGPEGRDVSHEAAR